MSLLESCTTHIPGLGSLVVKLVEGVLQHCHKGIHQLMNFIKHLSPDQCKMLNKEVNNSHIVNHNLSLSPSVGRCYLALVYN